MAILLNNLYNDIRARYSLKLIAGENGLFKIAHWLYFTEDIYNIDFLRGGELVITTGLGCNGESWIQALAEKLVQNNASGLIINTGKYITPAQISPKIKEYCNQYSLPLFTMPWHIHISDITEDIYNRFFDENKKSDIITDAVTKLLKGENIDISPYKELSFLNTDYTLFYISSASDIVNERLMHITIENYFNAHNLKCRLIKQENYILISESTNSKKLSDYIISSVPHTQIGISTQRGKDNLPLALKQGKNALIYGKNKNKAVTDFSETGIYQIYFSTDKAILQSYYYQALKPIIDFDSKHNSELLNTLEQYIKSDGSILQTSILTSCHRNTINYRIKKIKELVDYDLNNTEAKHRLYTAFTIKDFLSLKEENTNERNKTN